MKSVPETSIAFAPLLPVLTPVNLEAKHTIGSELPVAVTVIAPVLALDGIARNTTSLLAEVTPTWSIILVHVTPLPDTVGVIVADRIVTMTKSNSLGLTVHEAKLTEAELFLAVMDCAIATATN